MKNRETSESGVALIMVLLLMMVFTILMLGLYFETTGEQNVGASDRDNTVTFYAAQGALENMSSALAEYFSAHTSPTPAEIASLAGSANAPVLAIYNSTGSSAGQNISFPVYSITNLAIPANPNTSPPTVACTPTATTLCSTFGIVQGSGALAGLMGIYTPFLLTVVADGPNNTEVKMTRMVQEVAVPVFQYGIFSQSDLSFFAGAPFSFGGKTATNGNLFLAESAGNTLTLNDKVSAYLGIITSQLANGSSTTSAAVGDTGTIDVTEGEAGGCPGSKCLALTEGSVTCPTASSTSSCGTWTPNTSPPSPPWVATTSPTSWQTLSKTTYGGYIESGSTGAKQLNLALALANQPPIAMIERPAVGESVTGEPGEDRFFNQASVRILLSDTQGQITEYGTEGVTNPPEPYPLAETPTSGTSGMANAIQRTNSSNAYYLPPASACAPPVAQSPGWSADNDYMFTQGTTLLGGYIKIEIQLNSSPGTWQDVTGEILSLGISHDTMSPTPVTLAAPTTAGGGTFAAATYYYKVTALNSNAGGWGETLPSKEESIAVPKNDEVKLSWNAVTGATGYKIYRGTASGAETGYLLPGAVTSYTDTGAALTAGAYPTACTNNSILHLEQGKPGVILGTTSYTTNTNYIPINIYDPREGEVRDSNSYTTASMNGVMNILEVDVGHLQQWLTGLLVPPVSSCTGTTALAPVTGSVNSCGPNALFNSGYILYISDRRSNCNQTATGACTGTAGSDTGMYGYEDTINPASGTGTPNGTLDTGEDVNGNGVLDTYGGTARPLNTSNIDTSGATKFPTGSSTTLTTFMASIASPSAPTAAPLTRITSAASGAGYYEAQKNPVLFFRRAVRLVDGTLGNLPPYAGAILSPCPNAQSPVAYPAQGGFSVASENPVYILGDYNASNSLGKWSPDPAGKCHVPAAVFADAVTLLSNNWTDSETFTNPTNVGARTSVSTETWYRVAIIAGKNMTFPLPTFTSPAAPPSDFGTDGGTHNFLRYIENWGTTLNYLGAMVSFYYAQQATGVYKCCSTVYSPPTRSYAYDTDFTNITSLPPGTPRFTDVNALSYQQVILSTQ